MRLPHVIVLAAVAVAAPPVATDACGRGTIPRLRGGTNETVGLVRIQKTGSTALYADLAAHPNVTGGTCKETRFWPPRTRRGDRWDDRASVLELRGRPRAHYNGLGGKWLDFHRSAICGEGSPCSRRRPAGNAKDTRRVP